MTTIRERSTAALAEALRSLGDAYPIFRQRPTANDLGGETWWAHEPLAKAILAASPTLARRLDLGTAWDEAVAALPEGWALQCGHTLYEPERGYGAIAHKRDWRPEGDLSPFVNIHPDDHRAGYGRTLTDALIALTAALRERAR